MNSKPKSRFPLRIKGAMPPVDALQIELARYLEERFNVSKITGVLELNHKDYWKLFRAERPETAPPVRHILDITVEDFDFNELRARDVRFIKKLAAKYNFNYEHDDTRLDHIFLNEQIPAAELYAMNLIDTWIDHEYGFRLPFTELPREDLITATKVFRRFVQYTGAKSSSIEGAKADAITGALVRRIGGDILNEDHELAQLVT